MKHLKETGEIQCNYCKIGVAGLAVIGYTYEDDYADEHIILHEDCARPYKLSKAGKSHKCPKCEGLGYSKLNTLFVATKGIEMKLVYGERLHLESSFWASWKVEKWKEDPVNCSLCDGDGFLSKEPIPVVSDWKKA